MPVRSAAVAGQFYQASLDACQAQIEQMLPAAPLDVDLPSRILAGVVPHAGWVFSGDLASMVFSAIKQQTDSVDTLVIFGAVHAVRTKNALLYDTGSWQTPLGPIDIDESLAADVLSQIPDLVHP
ncbi:MAG: AmmeMemoRadiSam system protein B, partial [Planctomycetes bacterium]|nr:AmmeMemoRadiSam system protein B [Planctomycetota bacterium]